jgi:uncharacterized protein YjiS (DUF1127 family)
MLGIRSKKLKSGSTTQEAKDLGKSANLRRTVREWVADRPSAPADRPWVKDGPFVLGNRHSRSIPDNTDHPNSTLGLSEQHSRTVRPARTICHLGTDHPSNRLQQKPITSTDRTPHAQEHDEHATNTKSHGPFARSGWTIWPLREMRTEPGNCKSTPIHLWIYQMTTWIETRFWEKEKRL